MQAPPPPIPWPRPGAPLDPLPLVVPERLVGTTVAVDAGHGSGKNHGANSCFCIDEQDVVLPIAEATADTLERAGLTVVRLRPPGTRPSYSERLATLARSEAVAMISVHADVRLPAEPWMPNLDCEALISEGQTGFTVLWSDEQPELAPERRHLATTLATHLSAAGLPAYDGRDYVGKYEGTDPGVFVDRHAPRQRVRFLRAPAVPSVIVEVGHLLDIQEHERLLEPHVIHTLGHVLAAGVIESLSKEPPP